jgi:hypothetical protein
MSPLTIPIRPRKLRTALVLVGLGAALAVSVTGVARADGVLSHAEAAYVDKYHDALCKTIDQFPNMAGVMGVMQAVREDGFAPDSAADIVNASVSVYCPSHWQLLVDIGNAARGERSGWVA